MKGGIIMCRLGSVSRRKEQICVQCLLQQHCGQYYPQITDEKVGMGKVGDSANIAGLGFQD